jgi:DNA-binding CsgD family transcriptional regulator
MLRTVLIYGALLGAGAFGLQWLQFRYLMHAYPGEVLIGLIALAFLILGLWAGARLFGRVQPAVLEPSPAVLEPPVPCGDVPAGDGPLQPHATVGLGVSSREREVLQLLAAGQSNKEIARQLGVSPNTIKTHVSRLFEKLKARRRTEAIARARELGMLP